MYTIITRNDCNYCDKAKAMLELDNIPYSSYNLEEPSSKWVLSLMKEAGIKTVPQVFSSDGTLIGGYRELEHIMGFCSKGGY